MANTVKEQWREIPESARIASAGLVAGAIFGLFTKNVVGAVAIAVLLAVVVFVRPVVHSPARGLLTLVAAAGCLAIAFGTADLSTANGAPQAGGTYSNSPYVCGSVLKDPIRNPLSNWEQVEQVQTHDGYDKPGSTALIDDCTSKLKSFRIDTAVLIGITVLALLGATVAESRWRKKNAAES